MSAKSLDASWLEAHPLPMPDEGADKNGRGRVLLIGGARFVPGALALTGEASLRAGAGKLQMATVEAVALALGVLVPEAAMIALPMREDGEIAPEAVDHLRDLVSRADAVLIGPGMSATAETGELVERLLALGPTRVLLDAAALTCARVDMLKAISARVQLVLTPHFGEMARLADCDISEIAERPREWVARMCQATGAVIALKGPMTWIGASDGTLLHFEGGNKGLATGGSGDVLAGVIGGLLARGAEPIVAAGWGVSLHGAAGQSAAHAIGSLGYLARDLLPFIPKLLETCAMSRGN